MAEIILEVQDGSHGMAVTKLEENNLRDKLLKLLGFIRKYEKATIKSIENYEIR